MWLCTMLSLWHCTHCSYREVLRCLLEGIQWLLNPGDIIKVAGKSGISQARTCLGWKPIQKLHDEIVKPIAIKSTKGAWYRDWRLVSLDCQWRQETGPLWRRNGPIPK
jgi:hypothetical protein